MYVCMSFEFVCLITAITSICRYTHKDRCLHAAVSLVMCHIWLCMSVCIWVCIPNIWPAHCTAAVPLSWTPPPKQDSIQTRGYFWTQCLHHDNGPILRPWYLPSTALQHSSLNIVVWCTIVLYICEMLCQRGRMCPLCDSSGHCGLWLFDLIS